MQMDQKQALRSFRRVKDYLASHPLSSTGLGIQEKELDEVIEQLGRAAEEQDAARRISRAETRRQQLLRDEIWEQHMRPISLIARRAFDPSGLDRALLMPRDRHDNDVVIAGARAMARAAEPHRQLFVDHGIPADFAVRLRRLADELEVAQGARVESRRRQVIATATLGELVRQGRAAVFMLDAIVRPRLAKNPDWLAAWDAVKQPAETGGGSGAPVQPAEPDIRAA